MRLRIHAVVLGLLGVAVSVLAGDLTSLKDVFASTSAKLEAACDAQQEERGMPTARSSRPGLSRKLELLAQIREGGNAANQTKTAA